MPFGLRLRPIPMRAARVSKRRAFELTSGVNDTRSVSDGAGRAGWQMLNTSAGAMAGVERSSKPKKGSSGVRGLLGAIGQDDADPPSAECAAPDARLWGRKGFRESVIPPSSSADCMPTRAREARVSTWPWRLRADGPLDGFACFMP